MTFKTITAWEALQRSEASRRTKSVEPALKKIHALILEAADDEKTFADITPLLNDVAFPVATMIRIGLGNLGYKVDHINSTTKIFWENAKAPATDYR
jgi:hypothetical protein